MTPAERAVGLLAPEARAELDGLAVGRQLIDLLPDEPPPQSTGVSQDLMLSRVLPRIYERYWRPLGGRLLMAGTSMKEEKRIARLLLGLTPGDGVLDVACGPGNFTREFGRIVGPAGLAVGIDASPTMLDRALQDTPPADHPSVAFVRGDATHLPFRDASFDAVCCFAALYLFAEPFAAIAEMARVLTPGGRVAIMTSCRTRSAPLRTLEGLIAGGGDLRLFERDDITNALDDAGLVDVRQRIAGFAQFVGARKP